MWPVIGQDRIVSSLDRSLSSGKLFHAYLLVGPKHVGKMTLAVGFAQALNCASEDKPCGECHSCRRIASGSHSDVEVIRLAEVAEDQAVSRKMIGVDQIREMQRNVNLNSYEGGYRVIIIDGAEFMSEGAANSLLKTLEEPPSATVFILLASEEKALLPTIHSRCQRLELKQMSARLVQQALIDRWGVPLKRAELLARISHGCVGWAISAVADESILEERSVNMENFITLAYSDVSERFHFASGLAAEFGKSRMAVRERMEMWLTWWRDLLLLKSGCAGLIVNIDREDVLRRQAEQCSLSTIGGTIKSIRATMQHLEKNANARLAFEVLMLNIPILESEAKYA